MAAFSAPSAKILTFSFGTAVIVVSRQPAWTSRQRPPTINSVSITHDEQLPAAAVTRTQQTPHVMSRLEQCVGGEPRFRDTIGKMRFPLLLLAALWLRLCPAQTVPTPESVLGHRPGDDFYLANY